MNDIINGIRINYEVQGEGEPLLFIHGLGSSQLDWEEQVGKFREQFKVITLDLRGHGQSEKPRGKYTMALFAKDVIALMDHLGIEKTHLVGHSLGGMVAFEIATKKPERLLSLCILNSVPEINIFSWSTIKSYFQRQVLLNTLGMRGMAEIMSRKLFPYPKQRDLRRKLVKRFSKNDKRTYNSSLLALKGWSVYDDLHRISVPVLVVNAEFDYWPLEEKQEWMEKIPNVTSVVIEDSRHVTNFDQPQAFNEALMGFLKPSQIETEEASD